MSVSSLQASFDTYIRTGFSLVPIPPGTKGPTTRGWNRKENALQSASLLPEGWGAGLAHAFSGTMALDIDEWDHTKVMLSDVGIDLDALYNAPDAVTIESGVKGHGKLLYAMPFGMALPTKRINYEHEGQNKVAYELRCGTKDNYGTAQDILPPTIHPVTQMPYQWGGRGNWQRLPTCPIELLSHWDDILKQDTVNRIRVQGQANTSWDEVRNALFTISPDCSREVWVTVGMALHAGGCAMGQQDQALALWDEWSAQSGTKYKGPNDINACWRSFHQDDGVTLGSLFHHARMAGWSRPLADASAMFAGTVPSHPKVAAGLRPAAPDLDLDLWPEVLVRRAKEISTTMGCDPLVPLIAGLGSVCGAVDARIRLELMHEWKVPPVLWLMTIGEPADKKTPGSAPMFDVLEEIERTDTDRYKAELLIWEGKEAAYAAAKKAFLVASANPLDTPDVAGIPALPPQPVPARIIVSDITSQKLVRQCADRPRGMLCYLDEMAGWVSKLTNYGGIDDRSTWVRAYEAKSYRYDRVSAGTIDVEHFALSMYGNIQPKVFRDGLAGLSSDGLLQRFIPIVLRWDYTKRNEPGVRFLSCAGEYDAMIKRCYTLPERTYTLSAGAYRVFREFQTWYEQVKNDERVVQSNDTYMTAFGKLEGTCGRMALVWHLSEAPYEQEVSEGLMARVVRVARSYVVPSLRYVYNVVGGTADNSLDVWVSEHILHYAGERETITLSEIKRSARRRAGGLSPAQLENEIRIIMDWLASQNWVGIVEETRRGVTWAINATLAVTHVDYRRTVIEANQRMREELLGHFAEGPKGLTVQSRLTGSKVVGAN